MQIVEDVKTANRAIVPDEGNADLEGQYCIHTKEHLCVCCESKPWVFIHYGRRIIVWKEKDDPALLQLAGEFKKMQVDPRIVEYKVMMGKAVEWENVPNGATIG